MKKLLLRSLRTLRIVDVVLLPVVYPAALLLKFVRRAGVHRLPQCRNALLRVGVFPIRDHYYEPQFDHRQPKDDFASDRRLPGIDWNISGQLDLLERLTFSAELVGLEQREPAHLSFHLHNGSFESGDAEYWYQLLRATKPRRIIEVGSGHSTLMAIEAVRKNRDETPGYDCEHVCIEPYEMPWLDEADVSVMRQRVEDVDPSFFERLEAGDVLFIDSSHVIRPQGDVTFEYLELLPTLRAGVIVHVHDIFSPRHYPRAWLEDEVKFWNEQYLLEAFLTNNESFEVIGSLNHLHHHHHEKLRSVAPSLEPGNEPGSFYLRKLR